MAPASMMGGLLGSQEDDNTAQHRLVEYFAVCGLGLEARSVQAEGRFYYIPALQLGSDEEMEARPPNFASLLDRFPPEDHSFELPNMLPSAVLPCGVQCYSEGPCPEVPESMPRVYRVVLTDGRGSKIYVAALAFRDPVDPFLARTHGLPTGWYADKCICIVSRLPFAETFSSILQELHYLCFRPEGCPRPLWEIITSLTLLKMSTTPNARSSVRFHEKSYVFVVPSPVAPRLPNVSFLPLVESLDVDSIIQLFLALLTERKVLLLSANLKLLTVASEALLTLVQPLKWQSPYVPVLPWDAMDAIDAPVPFFFGVCTEHLTVKLEDFEGVVVADLDRGTVQVAGAQADGHPTLAGIAELPLWPGSKLKKSLHRLLRPQTSSMMSVQHALPHEIQADLDLKVALEEKGWGPRHEDRFQLAFLRFIGSVLDGYRDFLSSPHGSTAEKRLESFSFRITFQEEPFLESRRNELGEQGENLLRSILSTQAWPVFLAEAVAARQAGRLEPDAMIDTLQASSEKQPKVARRPGLPSANSTLAPAAAPEKGGSGEVSSLFRMRSVQNVAELLDGIDYSEFPESPASVVRKARQEDAAETMRKRDMQAQLEERSRTERQQLDNLSKMIHHLHVLGTDPRNADSLAAVQAIVDLTVEQGTGIEELLQCVQGNVLPGKGPQVFGRDMFLCLGSLLRHLISAAAAHRQYSAVAAVVEMSREMFLDAEKQEDRTCLLRELRRLDIWHSMQFWEAFFDRWAEEFEEEEASVADIRLHVLMKLVRVMAEVGLRETEVSSHLDELSGGLSTRRQMLVRDHYSRLRVLVHPQVRNVTAFINHVKWRHQASRAARRWADAIGKVVAEHRASGGTSGKIDNADGL